MMLGIIGWEDLFIPYQRQYIHLLRVLQQRYDEGVPMSPNLCNVLDPFRMCPYSDLRLVILGQDPYKVGATGLAFSTRSNTATPSLRVLTSWLGLEYMDGDLSRWARQGVLLINAIPTLELGPRHKNISHRDIWEELIRGCLHVCSMKRKVAFLILGTVAVEYVDSIDDDNLILTENHPSYYARINDYRSKTYIFDEINDYLHNNGRGTIRFI